MQLSRRTFTKLGGALAGAVGIGVYTDAGRAAAQDAAGSGGTGTLFVNGEQAAQGRIDNTVGYTFSLDEGMDVGMDLATPVSEDYPMGGNAFTGAIRRVTLSPLRDPPLSARVFGEVRRVGREQQVDA